jgi:hypothetical protein
MSKKWKHRDKDGREVIEDVADDAVIAEESAPEEVIEIPMVDFDGWYGARRSRIPVHHHKEILKADFKARKMPVMGTMAQFDEMLKLYGVKLA